MPIWRAYTKVARANDSLRGVRGPAPAPVRYARRARVRIESITRRLHANFVLSYSARAGSNASSRLKRPNRRFGSSAPRQAPPNPIRTKSNSNLRRKTEARKLRQVRRAQQRARLQTISCRNLRAGGRAGAGAGAGAGRLKLRGRYVIIHY